MQNKKSYHTLNSHNTAPTTKRIIDSTTASTYTAYLIRECIKTTMNLSSSSSSNSWASAFFDSGMTTSGAVAIATNSINSTLPRFTDHSYHDFSTYIENGGKVEKHKKCDRNFPARLHAILADERYAHIISWMPHGRAWKVLNKDLLVDEVIPKFFGQSKYASFTRQLSGWGFKRLHQTGPDFGCYYHECFLRGHPKLTVLMRRISPGQGKATPNAHTEPDFYLIAQQLPLRDKGTSGKKKSVQSSKLEDEKRGGDGATGHTSTTTANKKPPAAAEEQLTSSSFDPLPLSSYNSLKSFAAPAPSSSSRRDASSANVQFHVNNVNQYFGKAQDDTSRIYAPSMFFNEQYNTGTTAGNLYQNAAQVAPRSQPKPLYMEDGLCPTDGTSCHGNKSAAGNVAAPHSYPPAPAAAAQSLYQNPSTYSLGYGSMNMNMYSQHQPYQTYFQQGQQQQAAQGQSSAFSNSSYAATGSSQQQPNRFSSQKNNTWDNNKAAVTTTKDSLNEMPMSIPEKGFNFDVSSIEASFCNSPVETTAPFSG